MSASKELIRREIRNREHYIVATVISDLALKNSDQSDGSGGTGGPQWVVDLDIGSNRPLLNVPVKASGSGARFYAQRGQVVTAKVLALGRMIVIGPGDAIGGEKVTTYYSLETSAEVSSESQGFQRVLYPLEFHMGPNAMKGNPAVTFSVEGGDDRITRDAGSWADDGITAGAQCRIGTRSNLNAGLVTINSVVSPLILEVAETLIDEGPLTGVTIGVVGTSYWNDGIHAMPYSELVSV